jgi:hypothetical protein
MLPRGRRTAGGACPPSSRVVDLCGTRIVDRSVLSIYGSPHQRAPLFTDPDLNRGTPMFTSVGLPQFAVIVVVLVVFIIYTQRHRF